MQDCFLKGSSTDVHSLFKPLLNLRSYVGKLWAWFVFVGIEAQVSQSESGGRKLLLTWDMD